MLSIIQPEAILFQQLIVDSQNVTIGCMTEAQELTSFALRINEICDDMDVPPKGKARQSAVAKLFEISQNGARKWLEGEGYPTLAMSKRISIWASVHVEWLLTGRGPKPVSQANEAPVDTAPRTKKPLYLIKASALMEEIKTIANAGLNESEQEALVSGLKSQLVWLKAQKASVAKNPRDLAQGNPATDELMDLYIKSAGSLTPASKDLLKRQLAERLLEQKQPGSGISERQAPERKRITR